MRSLSREHRFLSCSPSRQIFGRHCVKLPCSPNRQTARSGQHLDSVSSRDRVNGGIDAARGRNATAAVEQVADEGGKVVYHSCASSGQGGYTPQSFPLFCPGSTSPRATYDDFSISGRLLASPAVVASHTAHPASPRCLTNPTVRI